MKTQKFFVEPFQTTEVSSKAEARRLYKKSSHGGYYLVQKRNKNGLIEGTRYSL